MPAAALLEVARASKRGPARGIYSVCSANRFVLEAAMREAALDGSVLLVESTCNQVNQFGGYTGLVPSAFVSHLRAVAQAAAFPPARVILGGDHLGPFPWQGESAESAMAKARELVRQCVLAGYAKIHLDASMRLADDPGGPALDAGTITERAADLAGAAEAAHRELGPGAPAPLYVIGTDVPPPGGERGVEGAVWVTRPRDAERTIALTRAAFERRGLGRAFERVIAVVVQPGVDFGEAAVLDYDRPRAAPLRALIEGVEGLVYEAHSTDYQTPAALRALVEDHFAILKVGPALTFAFREAVFGLAEIEREWRGEGTGAPPAGLRRVLEEAMLADPVHWRSHHRGDEHEQRLARHFGLSDRIRYYWPRPEVEAALARLLDSLEERPAPLSLLSQYLPVQYNAVRSGALSPAPRDLIRHKILEVLGAYARACRMKG